MLVWKNPFLCCIKKPQSKNVECTDTYWVWKLSPAVMLNPDNIKTHDSYKIYFEASCLRGTDTCTYVRIV